MYVLPWINSCVATVPTAMAGIYVTPVRCISHTYILDGFLYYTYILDCHRNFDRFSNAMARICVYAL